MKKPRQPSTKKPASPTFVVRAERAMRRAARKVAAQHRALNLSVIVWEDGKVVEKRV